MNENRKGKNAHDAYAMQTRISGAADAYLQHSNNNKKTFNPGGDGDDEEDGDEE